MLRLKRIFRKARARIVFSHEYFYGIPEGNSRQSFDVMKYKKIRDKLVEEKLIHRREIIRPEMVSYEDLELVHSKEFLQSIKDPINVARFLKLGYVNPWDSYILEYFRVVTGGTLAATEHAMSERTIVFNLGGGFHHAQADKADGFCLVNDIAVAIRKFKQKGKMRNVLIIDLDYHQGDGNLQIFKDDETVFTFSMHASSWFEFDGEQNRDIMLPHKTDDAAYLKILKENLPALIDEIQPCFLFYVAGSDPYEKDTLADMNISREAMLERNMFVVNQARERKLPMVVLAGGGYGPDSWEIYYDFIRESLIH